MNIYDFTVKDYLGHNVSLKEYEGRVVLIVNTATRCGLTPQYEAFSSNLSNMSVHETAR